VGGGRCGSVRVRVRGRRPATRRRRQRAGYCQSGDSGGRILPVTIHVDLRRSVRPGLGYLVGLLRRSLLLVASDGRRIELSAWHCWFFYGTSRHVNWMEDL